MGVMSDFNDGGAQADRQATRSTVIWLRNPMILTLKD
jgi:hypothetical protein